MVFTLREVPKLSEEQIPTNQLVLQTSSRHFTMIFLSGDSAGLAQVSKLPKFGAPDLGLAEGSRPDLFQFSRCLPICSGLHLILGIPRLVPISSDLFRFVFRTNQSKSVKHPTSCLNASETSDIHPTVDGSRCCILKSLLHHHQHSDSSIEDID